MLHRNGKEVKQLFRNGKEAVTLYKNGVIIYNKSDVSPVTKTFQDLINEGYISVSKTWPNGNSYSPGWEGRAVGLTVSPDCPYTMEQISDFDEIFNSTKMVSFEGVVGEGTLPNAFLWPQNHWLSDDEIYTLYNNITLSHDVIAQQFKYLNWSNKPSLTIKYNSELGNWYFTDGGIFGPNMPEIINFDVGNRRFSSTHDIFGRHNKSGDSSNVPMSNTVTFNWITTTNNGVNDIIRSAGGMFENASKLTTITGISFNNANDLTNSFSNCSSLISIPLSLATNGISAPLLNYAFNGCTSLVTIEPVLKVSNVTANTDTFASDINLTTLYLNGINAQKNQNWNLSSTNISSESINYIIDNLTEWSNFDPNNGDTYKSLLLPANRTLTNQQINKLNNNGWKVYSDNVELHV